MVKLGVLVIDGEIYANYTIHGMMPPLNTPLAADEWNIHDEAFMNLPRHRRSQGGVKPPRQMKCHQ